MKENEGKWKKMRENERKWRKMKENERKWKKMSENARNWKKLKEHERKCQKMKENERTWKMKKMKKWKNGKIKKKYFFEKNWKMEKKWRTTMKKERKMKKFGFTRRILDDFQGFVSECVSFLSKNNKPFWEVIVFQKKSDNFHWTWNKNTHFTDENERKEIAKVSPSKNNYSFRII